jgi:para-nitrobenzyl esterase
MVFGESAGGFSACIHYTSPRAGEQFHAVISESGLCTANELERTAADAAAQGETFAGQLGCTGADALACLRAIDPFAILDAGGTPPITSQLPGGPFYQGTAALAWTPVVDGVVIPMSTRDALAGGAHANLPLIVGSNRDEGRLFHSTFLGKKVADEAEYRAALERRFGATTADAILARYPAQDFTTPNDALAEVSGDAFFVCPARRTARGAAASGASVYLYSFEHELEGPLLLDGGVIHAAEIPFVFGIDTFPLGRVGESGRPLSDAIQSYWSTFAATGDPAVGALPAWPRYDAVADPHLVLADPIAASSAHKTALCDFWDGL